MTVSYNCGMTQDTWTPTVGQANALKIAASLVGKYNGSPKIVVWRGYAGTGKTSALKWFVEQHGTPILLAPTGKAASRISEILSDIGLRAMTLHRWMYEVAEDEITGEISFGPKPLDKIARPENGVIVVDEASMVGRELWTSLIEAARMVQANILLVGDPFQLPPVEPGTTQPFSVLTDAFAVSVGAEVADMTEVMRQSLESPVIRASMMIREGKWRPALQMLPNIPREKVWEYVQPFYRTVSNLDPVSGMMICHRNSTRHRLNERTRVQLGLSGPAVSGEPILIRRNSYECDIYNGEIHPLPKLEARGKPVTFKDLSSQQDVTASWDVIRFGNRVPGVITLDGLKGDLDTLSPKSRFLASKQSLGRRFPLPPRTAKGRGFTPSVLAHFGYTLTCHSVQGSQADKILVVVEPSIRFDTTDGLRWIYTAVTRSVQETAIYMAV